MIRAPIEECLSRATCMRELACIRPELGGFVMGWVHKGLTVAIAAVSVAALTTTPASAAPNWNTVNTDGGWVCAPTVNHEVYKVAHQMCLIRRSNGLAQSVLVLRNNTGKTIRAEAYVDLVRDGGRITDHCDELVFAAGALRGCFGRSVDMSDWDWLIAGGVDIVNGPSTPLSSPPDSHWPAYAN
jgi:hypothetical protein